MKEKDFGGMHRGLPSSKSRLISSALDACGPPNAIGLAPLGIPILVPRDLPAYAKDGHH
jgi:hypothetical protein